MMKLSNFAAFAISACAVAAFAQPARAADGAASDRQRLPPDRSAKEATIFRELSCKATLEPERTGYEVFIEKWGRGNPLAGLQTCRKAQ